MVLDKIRQLNSLVTTVGTTQTSIIPPSLSSALPYTRTAVQSNSTRTVRSNSFFTSTLADGLCEDHSPRASPFNRSFGNFYKDD